MVGGYHTFLLGLSVTWNFLLATVIVHYARSGRRRQARIATWITVLGDLWVLGWFKYADFFAGIWGAMSEAVTVTPPGISFFTFTQIAFIVDLYRTQAARLEPLRYLLFVTYFPHLISGPLFHHEEMMKQFSDNRISRFSTRNFSVGLSIFSIGLFKKLVIADSLSPFVSSLFDMPQASDGPSFYTAWGGTLAYTFQIYFDFSAYSDMAIGLSKMFNIKLPINFFSPYKATSVIDFWRRWHITLSRFLRDYLYIPFGGSRRGRPRQYVNLLVTMVLGGIWHGAAMTFLVWGAIHGAALLANHAWRAITPVRLPRPLGWLLTFLIVSVAWVLFRSPSLATAGPILSGLFGLNGVPTVLESVAALVRGLVLPNALYSALPDGWAVFVKESLGFSFAPVARLEGPADQLLWILAAGAICFLAPNAHQIMRRFDAFIVPRGYAHDLNSAIVFRLTPAWAFVIAALAVAGLAHLNRASPFLYFQF